jgi:hypothetical protein
MNIKKLLIAALVLLTFALSTVGLLQRFRSCRSGRPWSRSRTASSSSPQSASARRCARASSRRGSTSGTAASEARSSRSSPARRRSSSSTSRPMYGPGSSRIAGRRSSSAHGRATTSTRWSGEGRSGCSSSPELAGTPRGHDVTCWSPLEQHAAFSARRPGSWPGLRLLLRRRQLAMGVSRRALQRTRGSVGVTLHAQLRSPKGLAGRHAPYRTAYLGEAVECFAPLLSGRRDHLALRRDAKRYQRAAS